MESGGTLLESCLPGEPSLSGVLRVLAGSPPSCGAAGGRALPAAPRNKARWTAAAAETGKGGWREGGKEEGCLGKWGRWWKVGKAPGPWPRLLPLRLFRKCGCSMGCWRKLKPGMLL